MKKIYNPNLLAHALYDYFYNHLPCLRNMSPNTIHSYRDSFVLLLKFVSEQTKCQVVDLDIDDINPEQVIAFLHMLEEKRHNSVSTRNIRLAAIHAFFQYLPGRYPEMLEHCQRILAIPFKRTDSKSVDYL